VARESMAEGLMQKDVAAAIKKKFDALYPGTTWHCIVGTHFASSIAHATRSLIFFSMQGQNVLLYRSLE
jgi:dynein light chain LC8-type